MNDNGEKGGRARFWLCVWKRKVKEEEKTEKITCFLAAKLYSVLGGVDGTYIWIAFVCVAVAERLVSVASGDRGRKSGKVRIINRWNGKGPPEEHTTRNNNNGNRKNMCGKLKKRKLNAFVH